MYVVAQNDRSTGIEPISEKLDASLDALWGVILPIESVDVSIDNVVIQFAHGSEDEIVSGKVWWSHIGRVVADDGNQGVLQQRHFGDYAVAVQSGEIRVGPSVSASAPGLRFRTSDVRKPKRTGGVTYV